VTLLEVSSQRSDGRAHVALRGELDRLLVVRGPEAVDRVFRLALLDGRLPFLDDPDDDPADAGATGA
jgi:hypothetical protein